MRKKREKKDDLVRGEAAGAPLRNERDQTKAENRGDRGPRACLARAALVVLEPVREPVRIPEDPQKPMF